MISVRTLENGSECCDYSENCCQSYFSKVPFVGGGLVTQSVGSMRFPFTSADDESDTGVRVRQLPSLDTALSTESASAQITVKNISCVVPAGNGSSPCMNSLTEGIGIHRVFGVDLFDIRPAESMSSEGIDDRELTRTRLDLRHHEDEMVAVTNQSKPREDCDGSGIKSAVNLSDGESTEKEIVSPSKDEIASRSDLMVFGHIARITSREVAA